jgi:CelD/BcsL family acetyltransferase involved in cellulose biosynthesis
MRPAFFHKRRLVQWGSMPGDSRPDRHSFADERRSGCAAAVLTHSAEAAVDHLFGPPRSAKRRAAAATRRARHSHDSALKVVVVEKEEELQHHVAAWQDLADHAMESNAFYEPWMLRPAISSLSEGKTLRFVFIYEAGTPDASGSPRLYGFFPLELESRFRNLPVRVVRLWKHLHCFLCTPLVRAERARETLQALVDWAARTSGAGVVDFLFVGGDGPFHRLLVEHAGETGSLSRVTSRFTRAMWQRGEDPETYLRNALSGGIRKEYRRQRKRLAELGRLEFLTLQQTGAVDAWLENFLQLEASGWKARTGTALAMNANERAYVEAAVRAGFARGQMLLQGLFLDDRPVAMLMSFHAGMGVFTFKIAYDETFAKFSPGVQMMLDVLANLYSDPRFAWVDSCAIPDHPMINRLWKERKAMQTVLVSTGTWAGNLLLSIYPAGRWLSRLVRGRRGAAAA